ncbi:MAG: hypothetical protein A2W99_08705 [Bacteroidetes bacterium GWF2_33_16]|nr:MAG: hypothetical protein A2X00_00450 [Bacteroidetes bacterium GWE2_32_14]OFY05580.1 MAG: hypothetical protein A2W99_08705 [Bacteroidetes bacterium GWF2_33_16]
MIRLILLAILTIVYAFLQAQTKIENVTFMQVGNNIVVTYDLYCNGSFDAQLFYSTNKGVSWNGPLISLSGDVNNVGQGTGKSITWNVLKDQNWLISDNLIIKVSEESKRIFTDERDNQSYKWVKIGEQVWMAENLNYDAGNNCWCYHNDAINCNTYGRLYAWETAKISCPDGWHLPTDKEWNQLEKQLGMSQSETEGVGWRGTNEGRLLKASNGWLKNGNGTNDYGFSAIPAGIRDYAGNFGNLNSTHFWSATESTGTNAWYYSLYSDKSGVRRIRGGKTYNLSVRCIKD